MKILITGSRGFIGSHLADHLIQNGHEVIHYDLKDGEDVLMLGKLKKKAKGVDGIVHFAAVQRVILGYKAPFDAIEYNIMGLSNVLRAAMKNSAWVLFGSSKTVFGEPEKSPVKEDDPKNPTNMYSLTKLASEMILKDFCRNYGLRAGVVRFSTIFGSERDLLDRAVPTFMYKAINDIDLVVEDPERALDPVFIDDVIPALAKLINILSTSQKGFFQDYNAATGQTIKIAELVNKILAISQSKAKIISTRPARSYDFGSGYFDNTKFKTLGFKATPLDDAIRIYHGRMQAALQANKYSKEEIEDMLNYYNKSNKS